MKNLKCKNDSHPVLVQMVEKHLKREIANNKEYPANELFIRTSNSLYNYLFPKPAKEYLNEFDMFYVLENLYKYRVFKKERLYKEIEIFKSPDFMLNHFFVILGITLLSPSVLPSLFIDGSSDKKVLKENKITTNVIIKELDDFLNKNPQWYLNIENFLIKHFVINNQMYFY